MTKDPRSERDGPDQDDGGAERDSLNGGRFFVGGYEPLCVDALGAAREQLPGLREEVLAEFYNRSGVSQALQAAVVDLDLTRLAVPALSDSVESCRALLGQLRKGTKYEEALDAYRDEAFSRTLADWRRSWLDRSSRSIQRILLPPNLRELDDVGLADVLQASEVSGIPLYLVPRASIARSLIRAKTPESQRAVLTRKFDAILEDCEAVLNGCSSDQFAKFALDAVAAAREGHHAAAQALATNALDSVISLQLAPIDSVLASYSKNAKENPPEALADELFEVVCVFVPVWKCHRQFRVSNGDRIPTTYSRHATVHAVSARQFSKRNTVQSIMLLASLIGFLPRLRSVGYLQQRRPKAEKSGG